MVHAVHRSIQVYQDFHRQTLSHLQQLEQDCYKLMPQFELEQVLVMVERAHQMKAGARYLNLNGFEQLSHHVKGRYLALSNLSMTFEHDLLKQLIQMQELFRLCLLSNVSTWQADLKNVVTKLPDIFRRVDRFLDPHPQFSQDFPSQASLESDIQRLLVSIVLIPELARLDMMLKNTPLSKLSEILISQLPRLQTLAQQLQLDEIQRSMQVTLLEIQARPSHAKNIGTQALLKWSDLCYKTLTDNISPPTLLPTTGQSSNFPTACVTELETHLIALSVELIEGNEDHLVRAIRGHAQGVLTLATTFEVLGLKDTTDTILAALRYHPDNVSLIGRLAVQDWLRYQLASISSSSDVRSSEDASPSFISETLVELAKVPVDWDHSTVDEPENPEDQRLRNPFNQVEMPDGFQDFAIPEASDQSQSIAITTMDLERLSISVQSCQREIEQLPNLTVSLKNTFQTLLENYHRLATVPIAFIFNRFHPMVDALGLQTYKEVNLQVFGGQLAIDRQKGEILYELLLPLISNAVIHGIEKAEDRQRLGKSRKGRLSLSAYMQGKNILIELQDDGRGLNFEVIREWVIKQYNLSTQEGNFLTESEILDYLFWRKHRKTSGTQDMEYVGLGAVQGTLETLNGSIGVSTVMTQGTTFRITLPGLVLVEPKLQGDSSQRILPLAATPQIAQPDESASTDFSLDALRLQGKSGLSLQLDTHGLFIWADQMSVYFLECDRIEEYVMPHVTEAHQSQNTLSWRNQSIPIFSLQDFLGQESTDTLAVDDDVILVLKSEQQFLALRAPMQHLVNETTLKINPLSQALAAPRYIYGTTAMEEDTPRLVVDVAALIAQQPLQYLFPLPNDSSNHGSDISQNSDESKEPSHSLPTIMVVDDSRTAREIVSMTLRKGGYEIIQAKDGMDALEQLRDQQAEQCLVDLIISDVAMPRMNGLEFLRQCRKDTIFRDLPIAMLSNCDSTTHSELALKEGADAYLTKPYDEDVFLGKIAKLLEKVPQALSSS